MNDAASQELIELIIHGQEERYLDYKASMPWEGDNKAIIVRTILSMANLRGGGYIVIGVEDQTFKPVGMQLKHIESFSHDKIAPIVNSHAEPEVNISITPVPYNGMDFIVIQVQEFADIPVLSKGRTMYVKSEPYLQAGKLYIRSRRMNETREVQSRTDMRDVIDLAIDKGIRRSAERLRIWMEEMGIDFNRAAITPTDDEQFDLQLREMG